MAGKLVVSTLNNDTGVLATQNGMTGIAKAWAQINGSTGAIQAAFNVGSITKNGTGQYTFNFSTAMPSASYSVVTSKDWNILGTNTKQDNTMVTAMATGSVTIANVYIPGNSGNTFEDCGYIYLAVFSA